MKKANKKELTGQKIYIDNKMTERGETRLGRNLVISRRELVKLLRAGQIFLCICSIDAKLIIT